MSQDQTRFIGGNFLPQQEFLGKCLSRAFLSSISAFVSVVNALMSILRTHYFLALDASVFSHYLHSEQFSAFSQDSARPTTTLNPC